MLVVPVICLLMLGCYRLAPYVDSGSMSVLRSTPDSRIRMLVTQLLTLLLETALLIALITAIGIVSCESLFPGELDIPVYLKLNAALLLLHLMLGGIGFLPACIFNDSKWYFFVGAGLLILFFLFQMLGNMGGDLEFFRYLTPFTLFPGEKIVSGQDGAAGSCVIMAVIGAALYGSGVVCFGRKDLPL